jgi:hypothetical protein
MLPDFVQHHDETGTSRNGLVGKQAVHTPASRFDIGVRLHESQDSRDEPNPAEQTAVVL